MNIIGGTSDLLKKAGIDGFIISLAIVILLACMFPGAGTGEGPFSLSAIGDYGVALVFFFYGLKLNREKVKAGLGNWKLPIVIHLSTFVLFPLILLAVRPLVTAVGGASLWPGCFFLAALPSTVSSSVVMVSIAAGNIPAAIFNASISSILGVVITPALMELVGGTQAGGRPLGNTIIDLVLQVLLPITLGFMLNRKAAGFVRDHAKKMKYLDQLVILVIVFTAFCHSFEEGLFRELGLPELLVLAFALLGLFFLVYFIIGRVSAWMGFSREDRITALFCGSKKSLVQGSVMVKVLFAGSPGAGLLLLPIMLYHALQLIVVSILAQRMAARA